MIKYLGLLIFCTLLVSSCHKKQNSSVYNDSFFVRKNGADMPVHVSGNKTSNTFILILHGGPGDGGLKYANHTFSNLLEKDYVLAYWDQRHQGNSHGHLNNEDIRIDVMVEDTHAVIKSLKQRYGENINLFLLGHSWGGLLGTAYLLKNDYQTEVNGWIESGGAHDFQLMNTAVLGRLKSAAIDELSKGLNTEKWQEILDYCNSIDSSNISWEETSTLNSYAGQAEKLIDLPPRTESELSELELSFIGANNPYLANINKAWLPEEFYTEIIESSYTNQLSKITIPTLLLWGKYDFKVPSIIGEKALENLGSEHKYLKIYEQSGHSSMRYQPTDFVNDVKSFIDAHK